MPECADPDPRLPFAGAYTAFAQVFPDLRIQHRGTAHPHEGWVPTHRLLTDPALRARLIAAEARHGRDRYGTAPRPDVAAGFWLHRYTWPLCLLFTLPWFLERRVPLPAVEQLASRRAAGGGGPAELALLPGPDRAPTAFACLPDDPAARRPGARPVRDEAELRNVLRTALADQLAPLLAAFRTELRRGPRTLWGLATDELVEGLWYAAGLLGEEERAVAALAALLPEGADNAPFGGAAAFRTTGPDRQGAAPAPARTRVSCCLYYTLRPAELCAGCPRGR
ncbi:(2Fe-2S)-binding protein [Kitasatospora sp. NBC_01287]|uniref:(2Fe-2S)-binding protein n=1 Tax=Kitasatospora sp. NBC_01287 TaxID=2903573 RepID=UPI00224ECE4C|nr:(2Fe-2S)-binding protein [Kitasatospora sp. NBC_01287]MCX4749817.1 (2Fe-2S)-binding protein [Kitasatospora sp. NBC_01287]